MRPLLLLAVLSMAGWCVSSPPPAWLDRLPSSPDRYIGIGKADKARHPSDYREAAQAAALAQISREISVRLRTETRSWVEEGPQGGDERYSQAIQAQSLNDLSGYERMDQYETEDAFWVYYALDKEAFRMALEEKERKVEAWWAREAAALEEELAARRIQGAMERWALVKKRVEGPEKAEKPQDGAKAESEPNPDRLDRMTTRLREVLRPASLRLEPAEWVLQGLEGGQTGKARAFLVDGSTGEKWKGPLPLSISNRKHPEVAPCRVETGAEGELDLEELFLECGLPTGTWKATWTGPEGMSIKGEVKAKVVKSEWALSVRGKSGGGKSGDAGRLAGVASELEEELGAMESPYFQWAAAGSGRPRVEVELREAKVDTLEGMYFATLRGTVRLPGLPASREVQGKAGHSDRSSSMAKALRDFARKAMRPEAASR